MSHDGPSMHHMPGKEHVQCAHLRKGADCRLIVHEGAGLPGGLSAQLMPGSRHTQSAGKQTDKGCSLGSTVSSIRCGRNLPSHPDSCLSQLHGAKILQLLTATLVSCAGASACFINACRCLRTADKASCKGCEQTGCLCRLMALRMSML